MSYFVIIRLDHRPGPGSMGPGLREEIVKAVCYVRVSTIEQSTHGVSLEAQEERLQAYCSMARLEVMAMIREGGVSGAKPLSLRPG